MKTQGWKKAIQTSAAVVLVTVISGCQTVPSGSPHPFTRLFDTAEPSMRLDHTVRCKTPELPVTITATRQGE